MIDSNAINCSGCEACINACPLELISKTIDKNGFIIPSVNEEKCINCGRCDQTCPMIHVNTYKGIPTVYAAVNKVEDVLMKSSSGGLFTAIADYIIKENGYVIGCVLDDECNALHVVTDSDEGIAKMRGSKYVQSDTGFSYRRAKELLDAEHWVLFVGTPCQVAGLKNYLRKDYEKLVTVDLICHGVASDQMFKDYIRVKEKENNIIIKSYKFRKKPKRGYNGIQGEMEFIKNKRMHSKRIMWRTESYFYYFMMGAIYRESCYSCNYASVERAGDLTIGDLWNENNYSLSFEHDKGTSVVLLNSEKGRHLFNCIKDTLYYNAVDINQVKKDNAQLDHPAVMPEDCVGVLDIYEKGTYEDVEILFKPMKKKGHRIVFKNDVKSLIPRKIRNFLRSKLLR